MHIYLLQQVHEAGVDLGQEAQEEDEREAQGEHWRGERAKARSVRPRTAPWPASLGASPPGPHRPISPVATSRAQKKKEAEKSVRPYRETGGKGWAEPRASSSQMRRQQMQK